MENPCSRTSILVGFAAAAGAFSAAAMMSTATVATARADDFTDVINAVDGDYIAGQAAFATASADFGSNDFAAGVAQLLGGVDDDFVSAPDNLIVGTVEVLTGESVTPSSPFTFFVPASFADALSEAQTLFAFGDTELGVAATDFAGGDYGGAALYDLTALGLFTFVPVDYLLLGAAVAF
jgi:hypothetical protein